MQREGITGVVIKHFTVALNSEDHNEYWHYASVIGKLIYLEKSTRPNIACAAHQCARFALKPRFEHSKTLKHIGRYLLGTKLQGIDIQPTKD
jgi:hypothetical protein